MATFYTLNFYTIQNLHGSKFIQLYIYAVIFYMGKNLYSLKFTWYKIHSVEKAIILEFTRAKVIVKSFKPNLVHHIKSTVAFPGIPLLPA
jgi:hypothetical protein